MAGEYSDIAMNPMSASQPGKAEPAPFEVVPESHLDFSYFKNRADFRDEFGGGIYGRPEDLMTERSHTPRSHLGGEWSPSSSRASSPAPSLPSMSGLKMHEGHADPYVDPDAPLIHPAFRVPISRRKQRRPDRTWSLPADEAETGLLSSAQVPAHTDTTPLGRWNTGGYGPVEQDDDPYNTSYEHYRPPR